MSTNAATGANAGVCVGELVWPKFLEHNHSERQQLELVRLGDSSETGIILDCTRVEVGNSEIINLLMRVRNHLKKANKEIVLFNVPESLAETIRLCNLTKVIPTAADAAAAKKLVCDRSNGKSKSRIWLETHPILATLAMVSAAMIAIAGYFTFA